MGDTPTADVDQIPWKTAPEHAEEAMRDLDISEGSDLWEDVQRLATQYGLEEPLEDFDPSPSSLAAGSIYLACLIHNAKRNQSTVAAATGVSTVAIRNSYHAIAEAEGIPLSRAGSRRSPENDDPGDGESRDSRLVSGFLRNPFRQEGSQ
ncbi:hypothetical protein [Halolamina salifodinae]|uniref:Transcription factor TFIIB cyclin-like domain-containing protein n=1 Tax=Halolamina salifodinae TaxID=1202767 RepID=A0A8T4GXQ0_9EURY|nr:hypothetical protein [Halolamina salifodinae]MBP1987210.1 hypothetical protein [Halolamina salifodinae]